MPCPGTTAGTQDESYAAPMGRKMNIDDLLAKGHITPEEHARLAAIMQQTEADRRGR